MGASAPRLRAEGAPLGVIPEPEGPQPRKDSSVPTRLPTFEPIEAEGPDVRLFPPEGSAEGCASGECLPAANDDPPEDDAPSPPPATGPRDDLSLSLADRWRQAVEVVRRASPRQGASLAFSRLLWIRPGEVAIAFQPAHGFHKATVVTASSKAAIEQCFAQHFGRPTVLKIETLPSTEGAANVAVALPGPSIAEQEQEVRRRRDQETEATVRTHPAVRAALKLLGGEIEHIQVLEPEPPPAEGRGLEPSLPEDA